MSIQAPSSTTGPGIVVVHPGANYAYQAVLAAQEGDLLKRFVTGVYYKPREYPYALVHRLPARQRLKILNELKRRQMEAIDPRFVYSLEWLELWRLAAFRIPVLLQIMSRIGLADVVNYYTSLFDSVASRVIPRTSENLVLAFQGGALKTLRKAKRSGMICMLDQANALDAQVIVEDEYRRLGLARDAPRSTVGRLIQEVCVADWFTAPSEFVVRSLLEVGVPREKIALIPFGVDAYRFHPIEAPPTRPFTVLYVGQISLRKGVHYLLEAWRSLQLPNARLILMGTPIEEAAQNILDRFAGMYERISDVPHHELHRFYQQADVFVLPSLAEGSAFVSYEAMASGLACVMTESSGSIARNGIDAIVVPPRDSGALCRALLELGENTELRASLGRAARARAEDFTWSRYRSQLRKAYERVWETEQSRRGTSRSLSKR